MPAKTWSSMFTPTDEQGQPIPPEELPLMIALATQRPAYKRFYIHGMNGVRRHIEVVIHPDRRPARRVSGRHEPVLGDPGMRVTLLGTRGSVPAPGPDTAHFGGNTPSVEVRGDDGTVLVLDAGTGIRRLGDQLPPDLARIDILLTHLHMDHIQGLGFFEPLYRPDVEVHIWGPASATMSLEVRLSRYLSPPLFPVHLRDLPNITCHEVPQPPFAIGPFRIQTALVCHPNPTVGYRIEEQGGILAYLPDHEPALCVADGQWLGAGVDLGPRPCGRRRPPDPRCAVHRAGVRLLRRLGAQRVPPRVRVRHAGGRARGRPVPPRPLPRRQHHRAPAAGCRAAVPARVPRVRRPRRRRVRGGRETSARKATRALAVPLR